MEHLELLIGLPALLLGGLGGFRLGRRPRKLKHAIAPLPLAALDHDHVWNSEPYLYDPSKPAWLYACTQQGCPKVLRSKVKR